MSTFATMKNSISLMIFPDSLGNAQGTLYYDDGTSYEYQNKCYVYLNIIYEKSKIIITNLNDNLNENFYIPNWNYIYIYGINKLENFNKKNLNITLDSSSLDYEMEFDMISIEVKNYSISKNYIISIN